MEKEYQSFVLVRFQGNDQKIVIEWYPIQEITFSYEINNYLDQLLYRSQYSLYFENKYLKNTNFAVNNKNQKKNLEV